MTSGPSRATAAIGPASARAPGRSRGPPAARVHAGRATASRTARLPPPRRASGRACAGGCEGRGRLRSRAGGSCRPPRRARDGRPSSRSASRRTAARGCGVSTATTSPSRTRRRSAARWSASPSGIGYAQDGSPRPGEEAGLDEQRHSVRLGDRLAVEALDRETLEAGRGAHARRARRARRAASPPPGRAAGRASGRRARRRAPPRRRAGRRGRRPRGPRGRPSASATASPRRTAGRDRPRRGRALGSSSRTLAQPLDRSRERELGSAETLDEVAAAADPSVSSLRSSR